MRNRSGKQKTTLPSSDGAGGCHTITEGARLWSDSLSVFVGVDFFLIKENRAQKAG